MYSENESGGIRKIALSLLLLSLSVCLSCGIRVIVNQPSRDAAFDKSSLMSDTVLIVGKVVMEPPMRAEEQKLVHVGTDIYRRMMMLICGDAPSMIEDPKLPENSPEFIGRIDATLDETFYVKSSQQPFYIAGGVMFMRSYEVLFSMSSRGTAYITKLEPSFYPGGYYVDIKDGDKAVYVGTIKYYRDKHNKVVKVEIIDDYDTIMPQYRRKFGTINLKKSLLKQGVIPE